MLANAIGTCKIVVKLSESTGKNLSKFTVRVGRFLQMNGHTHARWRVKCVLLLHCCKAKHLEKQVNRIATKSAMFGEVIVAFERQDPFYEMDFLIEIEIQNWAMLRIKCNTFRGWCLFHFC